MASTVENHVQLSVVDKYGNVTILYPINTAKDVSIDVDNNDAIPAGISTVQHLVDNMKDMAFTSGTDLVHIAESEDEYDYNNMVMTEINDNTTSLSFTWSSRKITENFPSYIPTKELKINDIIATPTVPTIFSVDGQNNIYGPLCPISGCLWSVEYFPVTVVPKNSIASTSEPSYETTNAFQRWTGYNFNSNNESKKSYVRQYSRGAWGPYIEVTN